MKALGRGFVSLESTETVVISVVDAMIPVTMRVSFCAIGVVDDGCKLDED